MSQLVATNSYVTVNGIDLSSYTKSVTLNYTSESQDATTMGQTTRKMVGGLLTWGLDVNLLWDKSTGGPEATLWGLVGTTSCWEFRPVNTCTTVINPSYSGVGTLLDRPTAAAIGTLVTMNIKVTNSGTLSRASSS